MKLPTYSLRRRLVKLLVAVVGALWVGAAIVAFGTAHREADEVFDAQLVQLAETLMAIVAGGEAEHVAHELAEHGHRYELPLRYQIWITDDGRERLLIRSPDAPRAPMVSATGFAERVVDGERWRFFGLADDDGELFVVVGQAHDARYALATELALHLLLPIGVGLPLMALAVWWVVGRAMRPLAETAETVQALSPAALAPLRPAEAVPAEVAPLIVALNGLIGRVEQALENERRFTADAAHELRTPLAALKVQAQVARRAGDDAVRARALDQVLAAVDRMGHLVEQLLTLARLEPQAVEEAFAPVALDETVRVVCAQLAPMALARGQELAVEAAPVAVVGNAVWLEVLVRNLVDNALRYTPTGGHIRVAVGAAGGARLVVADSGPGMSEAEQSALRARFARGQHEAAEGVGLGLSIVERIVALHGATLAFEAGLAREGGRGLAVVVAFAAA